MTGRYYGVDAPLSKTPHPDRLSDMVRTLELEHERLKAALQLIVAEAESDDGLTAWDGSYIAREALASLSSGQLAHD